MEPEGGTLQVPVNEIKPNPRQPRVNLQDENLIELASSIREHGILQPLIVTGPSNIAIYVDCR